ncbi:MAG TPA: lipid-A-disaccharide synthase [Leptolyngbyaceae cyanobacterium]
MSCDRASRDEPLTLWNGVLVVAPSMPPLDVLILSNGPGEISTWVRPVVKALRERVLDHTELRISVVLSPCANASGREADIARSFAEVDRVQSVEHFFPFLLWGKTADNWDWHPQGVVLFLGGDQFYPVVIGKRLGYRTVIYAEWDARWHRQIDRFGCMKPEIVAQVDPEYRSKFSVVGDLMADIDSSSEDMQAVRVRLGLTPETEIVGLMPGSKKDKLDLGVPFLLAVAEKVQSVRPQTRFVVPVAPMLSLESLAAFANARQNPYIDLIEGKTAELVRGDVPRLRTPLGTEVYLWQGHPAYDVMAQFDLCLTTVGANTAELGSLGIPMLVLLPTQKLDAMRAWDGIPGILSNLPLVGNQFAKLINLLALRAIFKEGRLFAWPNIWAKRQVVPEIIGRITPQQIADSVLDYLSHREKLEAIRQELRVVRGEPGAAAKLADLVLETVDYRKELEIGS